MFVWHLCAVAQADPETRAEYGDARMLGAFVLTTLFWFLSVPVLLLRHFARQPEHDEVEVSADRPCKCDHCGAEQEGRVLLNVAIRPPSGWFVHGIVDEDGDIAQELFCSEKCAAQRIDGA